MIALEDIKEVVEKSEILCTVTASRVPVVYGEWLKEGQHINAVGSSIPSSREFDSQALIRSKLFADSIVSLTAESGDYLIPLKEGVIDASKIAGEIGEVLVGKKEGRTSEGEITFFKSLGIAIEDVAAARVLYEKSNSIEDIPTFSFY